MVAPFPSEQTGKRVALFLAHYSFGSSSQITNVATGLAQRGYEVDIFLYRSGYIELSGLDDSRIQVHDLERAFSRTQGEEDEREFVARDGASPLRRALRPFLPRRVRAWVFRTWIEVTWARHRLVVDNPGYLIIPREVVLAARNVAQQGARYHCLIGVEAGGLIFANLVAGDTSTPILYYSLELFLPGHPHFSGPHFRLTKALEHDFHRRAQATIIQDEDRANLLLEANDVASSDVLYLPVSVKGKPMRKKTSYLREKFGLPDDVFIVLQLGTIHSTRLSLEVAETAQHFPNNWVLIMHGFVHPNTGELIAQRAPHDRVIVSNEPVLLTHLQEVVASADVGLAFYANAHPNDYYIGHASEKMARYTQCGLPVVACDFPSLKEVIEAYDCGICVSHPKDIPGAIRRILERYDEHRENAFRCFEAEYEFCRHFAKVIDYIDRMGSSRV